jgi:response regulator RpfG family c-di-GMP phosphodiesterase
MNEHLRILVVDDEEPILNVVKTYLEVANNYTVLTARDGLEALDIIKRDGVINCCVTDLSMPRLDGLELSEKIHLYDNTIPVIVMTGYPSMDKAIKTLKNGVVDFLTKPIKMDQLTLTIERVMRERSLFVENTLLKEEAWRNEKLLKINQELQQKIKEVETINLIFQRLDLATTSKDLFSIMINLSREVTTCDEAHFCIFGHDMTDPAIISSYVKDNNKAMVDAGYIEKNIIKKVADDGIPLLMKERNIGMSIMVIPLKIRSRVFGLLITMMRGSERSFEGKDLYFLNFLAGKASFLIENMALYENIYENLFSTLYAFVETIEARDPYTKQHSASVTSYAMSIAKGMGCSQEEMDVLNVSGNLHDIGKIGIPDHILLKPGRLTDEEYAVIKKHPIIGSNIIGYQPLWTDEKKIIKHHHERWDGNGYPDGLKGEEIPSFSRILSVADVYDALTTDRSYRQRMQESVALGIIQENAGTQFEPKIVDVFLGLYEHGKIVS